MPTMMNQDNSKQTVKVRKVYSGPLRDKARTQERLIDSVGKVLKIRGYAGLTLANVGKVSGLDRKNIYNYFGDFESLIKAYIDKKEFWKIESKNKIEQLLTTQDEVGKDQVVDLLQDQFETLLNDIGLQKIIHWEMAENTELLRKVADEKELVGDQLFKLIEDKFSGNEKRMRGAMAMILGGIYYLTIHAKSNGSKICGIDINEEDGYKVIEESIEDLIDFVFEKYQTVS